MTRQNLEYSTITTDRHTVTVATWTAGTDVLFRLMVDDRELESGRIPA